MQIYDRLEVGRRPRRAEHRADRLPGARELSRPPSAPCARTAPRSPASDDSVIVLGACSEQLAVSAIVRALKTILDAQYEAFNVEDSATDPVQFVHRASPDPADREIVGVRGGGAGLRPRRQRDGVGRARRRGDGRAAGALRPRFRSAARRPGADADRPSLDPRRRSRRAVPGDPGDAARARIDRRRLRRRPRSRRPPTSGRRSTPSPRGPAPSTSGRPTARPCRRAPATATSSRGRPAAAPASGSICSCAGWCAATPSIPAAGRASRRAQLVVPLDTHIIRLGRCLGLTRQATPGWKMAAEITAALRRLDPADPIRYDFALCHLGMMKACRYGIARTHPGCPLAGFCKPSGSVPRARTPRRALVE